VARASCPQTGLALGRLSGMVSYPGHCGVATGLLPQTNTLSAQSFRSWTTAAGTTTSVPTSSILDSASTYSPACATKARSPFWNAGANLSLRSASPASPGGAPSPPLSAGKSVGWPRSTFTNTLTCWLFSPTSSASAGTFLSDFEFLAHFLVAWNTYLSLGDARLMCQ